MVLLDPGFNNVRKGIKDGIHSAFVAAAEYAKEFEKVRCGA